MESYEVMKTGCFVNVDNMATNTGIQYTSTTNTGIQVYRFDDILAEKCNVNVNVSFTICPNVPG